jgi:hypothetical protein
MLCKTYFLSYTRILYSSYHLPLCSLINCVFSQAEKNRAQQKDVDTWQYPNYKIQNPRKTRCALLTQCRLYEV